MRICNSFYILAEHKYNNEAPNRNFLYPLHLLLNWFFTDRVTKFRLAVLIEQH